MVGLARQIQVLTQCLFLAVTVALLVVWNMELAGVRVGKRSPRGHSFPMSDTSLGLPLRVTGRPRPCLDLLPRPSFLVSHHESRRFLFFLPASGPCVRPGHSLVSYRVYCCCEGCSASLSSVFLPAVQRPVPSFTLVLVLRRDLVPAAPKISDVFHTRALVTSSLYPKTLRGQRLVMARGGIAVQIAVRRCSHRSGSDKHQHKGAAGLLHSSLKRPGGFDPSLYFLDDGLLTGTSSALPVFFKTLFAGIADIGHSVALTKLSLFLTASLTGVSHCHVDQAARSDGFSDLTPGRFFSSAAQMAPCTVAGLRVSCPLPLGRPTPSLLHLGHGTSSTFFAERY